MISMHKTMWTEAINGDTHSGICLMILILLYIILFKMTYIVIDSSLLQGREMNGRIISKHHNRDRWRVDLVFGNRMPVVSCPVSEFVFYKLKNKDVVKATLVNGRFSNDFYCKSARM